MKTLKVFSFLISLWLGLFMGREISVSSFSNHPLPPSFERVVSASSEDHSPDHSPWGNTQAAGYIQKDQSLTHMFGRNARSPQWVRHTGLRACPFKGSTFLDSMDIKNVQTSAIYGNLNLPLDETEHEEFPSRAS